MNTLLNVLEPSGQLGDEKHLSFGIWRSLY